MQLQIPLVQLELDFLPPERHLRKRFNIPSNIVYLESTYAFNPATNPSLTAVTAFLGLTASPITTTSQMPFSSSSSGLYAFVPMDKTMVSQGEQGDRISSLDKGTFSCNTSQFRAGLDIHKEFIQTIFEVVANTCFHFKSDIRKHFNNCHFCFALYAQMSGCFRADHTAAGDKNIHAGVGTAAKNILG